MNKCGGCKKFMGSASGGVECNICKHSYHRKCVNISSTQGLPKGWVCPGCAPRELRRDDTPVRGRTTEEGTSPSQEKSREDGTQQAGDCEMEQLKETETEQLIDKESKSEQVQLLNEIRQFRMEMGIFSKDIASLRQDLDGLQGTLKLCHTRIDEVNIRVDATEARLTALESIKLDPVNLRSEIHKLYEELQSQEQETLIKRSEELKVEVYKLTQELKKRDNEFRAEIAVRDQRQLSNEIEIMGITEHNEENLQHMIGIIATKLGVNLDERDVDYVRRVGVRREPAAAAAGAESDVRRSRPVVLRLTRRAPRDELMQAVRVRRGGGLTTEQLQVSGPSQRVYLNEHLTKAQRQLFGQTRAVVKEQGFSRVWLENVQLLDKYNLRNPSKGTLYFATTHLIFVDHEMRKETWILLMHISSVERLPITTTGSPLLVRTKTFQSVFFVIPRERDCHEMHQTLLRLSQPVHIDELYCFHYKCTPDDLPKTAGWNFFDIQTEFQRMNVPNDQWVLCNANKDYELCDTYPSEIYVPARASTAVLLGSASFRSRGRLPALSYLHHNKAAIARCSQPLSGFSARCMEDEQMLDLIRRANPNCGYMYVVDTRPRINAMVNRAAGKGYENEAFYENIKFQFMGIGNIHVMRKSLQKLVETCEQNTPTMSSFLGGLESSGWLKHIKSILDTSVWIANAIESGVSVCVHCSDGWDRTAQVCSLAALCLEPHYRTINGYQSLIEKDWLSFGHKFTARCGHIACDGRERSPVFTQLLDCTWQMLRQNPEAFQFNERFLLTLHDHAHACQYGTFVGNCQKDRRDLRLSERTFSLWGFMANHLNEYKNPLYNPKAHPDVIKPDLSAQSIRFWRGMYCRHENGVHPREPLGDLLPAAVEHCSALEQHINYLTKRISTFKNLLAGKRGEKPKDTTVVNFQNGNLDAVEIETKTEELQIDNKLLYESGATLSELECANHDHPLKEVKGPPGAKPSKIPLITERVDDLIPANLTQLEQEVNTVALDWKSLKNVTECNCSTPLDHFSRKHHCWGCGRYVCTRCVCRRAPLPALASPRPAPLCAACAPSTPCDRSRTDIVTPAN